MNLLSSLTFLLALGCGVDKSAGGAAAQPVDAGPVSESAPETTEAADPDVVSLTWRVSKAPDGGSLQVSYELFNGTDQLVYACDELAETGGARLRRAEARLIVSQSESGEGVELICGARHPNEAWHVLQQPVYMKLTPGASEKRVKTVPMPLTAWHNLGTLPDLKSESTQISLEIDYFYGEPEQWMEFQFDDGTNARTPESTPRRYQAIGEAKAIP